MKKRGLAQLQANEMRYEQLLNHTIDQLAEQLAAPITLLTNIDPQSALSVLDQLVEQRGQIEEALEQREKADKGLVDEIYKNIPDNLELEEDEA